MSTQSPPQLETPDMQAHRRLVNERVLKRVRLSKAKRALQTRLRLAGFKASHGWQDVSFEKIEPQFLQGMKPKQVEHASTRLRRQASRTIQRTQTKYAGFDQSPPSLTTPDHQRRNTGYQSEPEPTTVFSPQTTPQMMSNRFNLPFSTQPRSLPPPPTYPHTPEQIIRSKWSMARPLSQSQSSSTPEDDELRDQTTAAEMMLFLATGSPSPDCRSMNSVPTSRTHHLHHRSVQIQTQFHTWRPTGLQKSSAWYTRNHKWGRYWYYMKYLFFFLFSQRQSIHQTFLIPFFFFFDHKKQGCPFC